MRVRLGEDDTIAAISTAVGEGGIGIVRLSGRQAITIAEKVIKPKEGAGLKERRSHSIFLANVVDPESGLEIDEVLVTIMRAPNTYTREDVVEINCHGGVVSLKKTLNSVLHAGARAADPGEFTKRAFLNGRIDLAQAEAVIETIRAKTEAGLRAAINQLEGGLSKNIKSVAEKIADVLTQVEAAVDFSDEDIETLPSKALSEMLFQSERELEALLSTSVRGRMIREGIRTAIVGKPNVGKSSLLNALLRRERAIVTPIPGTTRDVIEEVINLGGVPLRLIDTAGIRESEDEIESIGLELTRRAIKEAELILLVVDGSQDQDSEDLSLVGEIAGTSAILVVNKQDLPQSKSIDRFALNRNFKAVVRVSALTGYGIKELEKKIEETFFAGDIEAEDTAIITNARHEQLVEKALDNIREAKRLIDINQPEEIVAVFLQEALDNLGEITGETIGEDVLGRIFSQFCIGK
ncbi:MAG: tRNA uridine-5-carboxymethylaminomethyl(34) synthesis GTPase MnmE [Actinomycetota bacterium]|nr:tRNA uridine-5-carboxymethylaminomethyl(34) synthesis GTPase MnmE [Actinomycetota bacterium]